MASGDAVSPPRRAGRQSASVVPPKALSSRPRCSGCVDDRLPWIGESVDMFRFVPRPFVVIGAVVVMLPLGGCLATTVGSFAATALMSAATGSTGPETPRSASSCRPPTHASWTAAGPKSRVQMRLTPTTPTNLRRKTPQQMSLSSPRVRANRDSRESNAR